MEVLNIKNNFIKLFCLFITLLALFILTSCGRNGYGELIEDEEEIIVPIITEGSIHNENESEGHGGIIEPDYYIPVELITPTTLEDLFNIALERREGIVKPEYGILIELFQDHVPGSIPNDLWEPRMPSNVTIDEALQDIEVFFEVMRSLYPGYIFFGGDEVFNPIKDAILAEISAREGEINSVTLGRILHRHLASVINDNHAFIANDSLGKNALISRITNLAYDKTENGFRNRETGQYITHIDGHDIKEVMRLYINDIGEIFYRPLLQGDSVIVDPVAFTYEDGSVIYRQFSMYRYSQNRFHPLPSLERRYDIPIVNLYAFGMDGHEDAWMAEHAFLFLSFIEELRNEPAIIIDLRNNTGGSGFLPVRWLYDLIGEVVSPNYVQLSFLYEFEAYPRLSDNDHLWSVSPEALAYFSNLGLFNDYFSIKENIYISNYSSRRIVENDQIIIVLTNRNTGSAAELFVDLTMNMSHTLVIGSSTVGTLAFHGVGFPKYLPNSGLPFGFGAAMLLWEEDYFVEGVGIQPDIWVEGDALVAALALLKNEGFGH